MKKMITGFAALLIASAIFAQPATREHYRGHGPRTEFKKLDFTDEQQQLMKGLNEDFHKQMKALNSNESITVKEQRDQREALVKAHKQKIESLMTPEQKNELAQLKADRQQKQAAIAAKRLDKMKVKLNLTDEQVATIKANQQNTHSKMEALMKDESIERAQKREQLMTLKEEMKNNIDKVLTAEQKTKMDSLRMERQEKMKSRDQRMKTDAVK